MCSPINFDSMSLFEEDFDFDLVVLVLHVDRVFLGVVFLFDVEFVLLEVTHQVMVAQG